MHHWFNQTFGLCFFSAEKKHVQPANTYQGNYYTFPGITVKDEQIQDIFSIFNFLSLFS